VTLESLFEDSVDLPPADQPIDPKRLPAHGGVFAFSDASGRLIQLLGCQNIRRSAVLRLSEPEERKAARRVQVRDVARRIWWVSTGSVFETKLRHLHLVRALFPESYEKQLGFGPAWFARARVDQPIPRWVAEKHALDGRAVDIGPFTTRRDCTRFIESLEDAFNLCRHYDILQQAPRGQTCAYFDMGRCAAPCNGTVSMDAYREEIRASMRFAAGETQPWLDAATVRMRSAADARQYELAGRIKATIEAADKLTSHTARITKTPDDFRYLIVQRGRPPRLVKPFFMADGKLEEDDPVDLGDVPDLIDEWVSRISSPPIADPSAAKVRSEQIWLVSHFLRKGPGAQGVHLHHRKCDPPAAACENVVRYFSPRRASADDP
jgi:excinuclease UvrABC nuclease subunit